MWHPFSRLDGRPVLSLRRAYLPYVAGGGPGAGDDAMSLRPEWRAMARSRLGSAVLIDAPPPHGRAVEYSDEGGPGDAWDARSAVVYVAAASPLLKTLAAEVTLHSGLPKGRRGTGLGDLLPQVSPSALCSTPPAPAVPPPLSPLTSPPCCCCCCREAQGGAPEPGLCSGTQRHQSQGQRVQGARP